jgi:ubiquitin-like-conjugating enzyme ATG10
MESYDCPMTDYLMLWLGLVGGCVGLWIPPEVARQNAQSQ